MQKIRFFLLWFLFFFTPIIYAWLYIPGVSGNLSDVIHAIFPGMQFSGFESVKVTFFLCIFTLVLLTTLIGGIFTDELSSFSRYFLVTLIIFFIWTGISLFVNSHNIYFSSGNPEKTHGWFFYLGLLVLFFMLKTLSHREKSRLLGASFWGFGVVIVYVFFQRLGFDPLQKLYETRLDRSRVFSTLGNPNYLAGLALMMLPLFLEKIQSSTLPTGRQEYKIQNAGILMFLFLGLIIYWTGSYYAWGTLSSYVVFLLFQRAISYTKYKTHSTRIALLCTGILVLLALGWMYVRYGNALLGEQKVKGFVARGFLWITGVRAIIADPFHFLFGYGPDGFLLVSERFRDWHLSNGFEDPAYHIDRAHNVFIDFIIHFGVPMFIAVMWVFIKGFRQLSSYKKASVALFAIYFFFNIPVLVHYLVLIQAFTTSPGPYPKERGENVTE